MGSFESEVTAFIEESVIGTDFLVSTPEAGRILIINTRLKSFYHLLVLQRINHDKLLNRQTLSTIEIPKETRISYLWEDMWRFHQPKIESKLRSLLGLSNRIYGRDTILKSITNSDLFDFLKQNHLNVPLKAKYKYGLFYDSSMFAVMSFSKSRPIERNGETYRSYELLRFCNKLNYTVVGGFSKLLQHFIKNVRPDDIMTYVDLDWSDGAAYEKAGFERVQTLDSMEFGLDMNTGERIYPHRFDKEGPNFVKAGAPISADLKQDTIKVYNSGSYKYILLLKK